MKSNLWLKETEGVDLRPDRATGITVCGQSQSKSTVIRFDRAGGERWNKIAATSGSQAPPRHTD